MQALKTPALIIALSLVISVALYLIAPTPTTRAIGIAACPCQMDPNQPNFCPTVFCMDTTSGFTSFGHCIAPGICRGEGTSGPNGFGIGQVAQILGPLMQQLMQGSQNGSASASDPTLAAPCQTTQPTGVAATLLASSSSSTVPLSSGPCDYGTGGLSSSLISNPLTGSFSGASIPSDASALTNALTGASCTDSTLCGISSLAGSLASPTSTASSGNTSGQSSVSLVPQNAIVPSAAATSSATSTQAAGLYGTGSSIAPQGLTVSKDSSAVIFQYAPIGQNAQIAGFISCDITAANAVPYVPLSAIQNACG